MATFTANIPLDMEFEVFVGTEKPLTNRTSTSFTVNWGGGSRTVYTGTNLLSNSGVITAAEDFQGGASRWEIAGISLTVARFMQLMESAGGSGIYITDYLNGADTITGSTGADTLVGYGGNDVIEGGLGNDTLDGDGNSGTEGTQDLASYASASARVVVNLDTGRATGGAGIDNLFNFEGIIGSSRNDSLTGDFKDNLLFGGDGDDSIDGAEGDDEIEGGDGDDGLDGGADNDTIAGDAGDDSLSGDAGNDDLDGGAGNDGLDGGTGNDALDGGTGNDELEGGTGNDVLNGGTGSDVLNGGTGGDRMAGGTGRDMYFVDSGADRVSETKVSTAGAEADTVTSSLASYTLTANVETLILSNAATNGKGNAGDNTITGNARANDLEGLDGEDSIDGGAGNDTLLGGDDNDAIDGGTGNDLIVGGLGKDALNGDLGADRFDFNAVAESRVGAAFRDVVTFARTQGDKIDITTIDASTRTAGDQDFAWVNANDLDAAFTRVAGQLRFANGVLAGDINGDGRADFEIQIRGALQSGDVIL